MINRPTRCERNTRTIASSFAGLPATPHPLAPRPSVFLRPNTCQDTHAFTTSISSLGNTLCTSRSVTGAQTAIDAARRHSHTQSRTHTAPQHASYPRSQPCGPQRSETAQPPGRRTHHPAWTGPPQTHAHTLPSADASKSCVTSRGTQENRAVTCIAVKVVPTRTIRPRERLPLPRSPHPCGQATSS